jgi:hypothetical protein
MLIRRMWPFALLVCVGGVALGGLLAMRYFADSRNGAPPDGAADGSPAAPSDNSGNESPAVATLPGFRAETESAGITFEQHFLSGEQGENFKVNLYDHGCGVAVGDCNGDGHDDIYFCNQLGANALYLNNGDGTFKDVTATAGPLALDDRVCVAASFADYDNDGDQDLFVTSTRGGNVLLRNDGRGQFTDVTQEAGVALVAHSQVPIFFDADLDGDLDLLVTNTGAWTTAEFVESERYFVGRNGVLELVKSPREYNVFYRNLGNGTFRDETEQVGLAGKGWTGDVAVFDYDEDGRPDLFITSMFGDTQLLRNQEDGTFRDVTAELGLRFSWGAVGVGLLDLTNDGRLDLYIADMHSDMWMSPDLPKAAIDETKKYAMQLSSVFDLDFDRVVFGNALLKNLGNGRFEEISDRAAAETLWPWGIVVGDFDNDGYQDVFQPSGMGYPYFPWRNHLLMNQGDETFVDQSRERGLEPRPGGDFDERPIGGKPAARSSRSAATADFDGDGRLDLIVNNFNDRPYLYRNEFPRGNFVQFRLTGTRSNRDAIGAVVRMHVGDEVLTQSVNPAVGYLAQSSKSLHFGLGARQRIDRVEIRWPSGTRQVLDAPAMNMLHRLTEPEASDSAAAPTAEG